MSFKIGGFLPAPAGDSAPYTPPPVANRADPEPYPGGTLAVRLKPDDTQETFVYRGLHDHAILAGLDETEANKFADQWTNKKTTFNHRADGRSVPYTKAEFTELKTGTSATFDLDPEFDSAILTDLNSRVEDSRPIQAETSFAYTPDERRAIMALRGEGVSQCVVAGKPDMMITSSTTLDGKPLTPDIALGRYIERHYNQSGRVWGDKTLEMVAQAKVQGVEINLQIDTAGQTAFVGVSASDKQKLDRLFNDALGETIKGEKASRTGQREAAGMAADIPITLINAANKAIEGTASIPSFLEDVARAEAQRMITPPGINAFPEAEAMIPKVTDVLPKAIPAADLSGVLIPNQSDLFNKDIAGKVNPDGQTLGKTAATITGAVIPIPLANAKTVQVTGRVAGEIADAAIRGGTNVVRKVEQFGQEAAAGMRTFGQPELRPAGGAPLTGVIDDAAKIKGSNVMESRAHPDYPDLQLPVNNGKWTGDGGNSGWLSDNPSVIEITKGEPVPFNDGYVDFSKWSKGEVKLAKVTGDNDIDFPAADKLYATEQGILKKNGTPNPAAVARLRSEQGLTWHHVPNSNRLELIPTKLHGKVPHSGSASQNRNAAKGEN